MIHAIVFVAATLFAANAEAANECAGTPYRDLGATCADLGLDSNRAVCRSGQRYALLCDDVRGGKVRTCRSDVRCGDGDRRHDDRRGYWDDARRHDDRRDYGGRRNHDDRRGYHDGRRYHDYRDDFRNYGYGYGDRRPRRDHARDRVYFGGRWHRCEDLRYNRNRQPVGFCARGRANLDCRGRCE